MKTQYRISLVVVLAIAVFTFTSPVNAQRPRNRAQVRSMQATRDASGVHADKFDSTGPVTFTCLNAVSETPNAQPEPSCHITAPGFNGTLKKGEGGKTTGAGAITLTCNGPGNLRCSARVDIPAPS
jgi:hypothetical protein